MNIVDYPLDIIDQILLRVTAKELAVLALLNHSWQCTAEAVLYTNIHHRIRKDIKKQACYTLSLRTSVRRRGYVKSFELIGTGALHDVCAFASYSLKSFPNLFHLVIDNIRNPEYYLQCIRTRGLTTIIINARHDYPWSPAVKTFLLSQPHLTRLVANFDLMLPYSDDEKWESIETEPLPSVFLKQLSRLDGPPSFIQWLLPGRRISDVSCNYHWKSLQDLSLFLRITRHSVSPIYSMFLCLKTFPESLEIIGRACPMLEELSIFSRLPFPSTPFEELPYASLKSQWSQGLSFLSRLRRLQLYNESFMTELRSKLAKMNKRMLQDAYLQQETFTCESWAKICPQLFCIVFAASHHEWRKTENGSWVMMNMETASYGLELRIKDFPRLDNEDH